MIAVVAGRRRATRAQSVVFATAVAIVVAACGPSAHPHHNVDAMPTSAEFHAFQTCDTSWDGVIAAGTTCQTPCLDLSNLGETSACTATSPLDGSSIACDPAWMTSWGGHHGCCFTDPAHDPAHVDFADCR